MTQNLRPLNAIQKSSKANLRIAIDPMSPQPLTLQQVRGCNVWCFVIRACIAVVGRRV